MIEQANLWVQLKLLYLCACYGLTVIALDKKFPHKYRFLFLHRNICCGYSLEVPHRGTSNEYPQHMFLLKKEKAVNMFWLKNKAILLSGAMKLGCG